MSTGTLTPIPRQGYFTNLMSFQNGFWKGLCKCKFNKVSGHSQDWWETTESVVASDSYLDLTVSNCRLTCIFLNCANKQQSPDRAYSLKTSICVLFFVTGGKLRLKT